MYSISHAGFADPRGSVTRWIDLGTDEGSSQWRELQGNALPGYRSDLALGEPLLDKLYRLFSCYIGEAVLRGAPASILDIGCGIGTHHPPYIAPLGETLRSRGIVYAGLDPMREGSAHRDYLFIRGRIEDVPQQLAHRFDMFIFSTSLDHFEDLGHVADAVRRLAARRAQCIFWIGLHDPSLIGEEIGRKWFSRLFESLNPFAFVSRALQVNAVMLYRYSSVLRRAWFLRKGAPLDDLHFHYFTRENVRDALARFGAIRQVMEVPGSASMFATVELTDARGA